MRKAILTVAAAAMLTVSGVGAAEAGCYRLGLTGYHWYRFCAGPRFMYPHHRVCGWRHGYHSCWYR